MMIEEGGGAVTDGIDETYEDTEADIFLRQ